MNLANIKSKQVELSYWHQSRPTHLKHVRKELCQHQKLKS